MNGRLLVAAWLITLGGIAAVVAWLMTAPQDSAPPATVVAVPALVVPLPPPDPPAPATSPSVEPPAAAAATPPTPADPAPPEATVEFAPALPEDRTAAGRPISEPPHAGSPEPTPVQAHPMPPPVTETPAAPDPGRPSPTADGPRPTGSGARTDPAPQTESPPGGVTPPPPVTEPPVAPAPAPPAIASTPSATPSPPEARPPQPPGILPQGADRTLVEPGAFGPLPRVAGDGRKPWQAYARPFQAPEEQPRIAIVIGNLGLGTASTNAAIRDLPGVVTLSFAPYAENLNDWVAKARAQEHEVLLDLPMEPDEYPRWDPGPKALFTNLDADENLSRLDWIMSRVSGYAGLVNQMGSRFTISEESLQPVLVALRDRGLLFVDSRSASDSKATVIASRIGLPRAVNDRFIDREPSREAILRRLGELERIARETGAALGVGYAYPVTIDVLRAWIPDVQQRGFAVAPVSAVVDRQPDR